jgi:hypothetical protein
MVCEIGLITNSEVPSALQRTSISSGSRRGPSTAAPESRGAMRIFRSPTVEREAGPVGREDRLPLLLLLGDGTDRLVGDVLDPHPIGVAGLVGLEDEMLSVGSPVDPGDLPNLSIVGSGCELPAPDGMRTSPSAGRSTMIQRASAVQEIGQPSPSRTGASRRACAGRRSPSRRPRPSRRTASARRRRTSSLGTDESSQERSRSGLSPSRTLILARHVVARDQQAAGRRDVEEPHQARRAQDDPLVTGEGRPRAGPTGSPSRSPTKRISLPDGDQASPRMSQRRPSGRGSPPSRSMTVTVPPTPGCRRRARTRAACRRARSGASGAAMEDRLPGRALDVPVEERAADLLGVDHGQELAVGRPVGLGDVFQELARRAALEGGGGQRAQHGRGEHAALVELHEVRHLARRARWPAERRWTRPSARDSGVPTRWRRPRRAGRSNAAPKMTPWPSGVKRALWIAPRRKVSRWWLGSAAGAAPRRTSPRAPRAGGEAGEAGDGDAAPPPADDGRRGDLGPDGRGRAAGERLERVGQVARRLEALLGAPSRGSG